MMKEGRGGNAGNRRRWSLSDTEVGRGLAPLSGRSGVALYGGLGREMELFKSRLAGCTERILFPTLINALIRILV